MIKLLEANGITSEIEFLDNGKIKIRTALCGAAQTTEIYNGNEYTGIGIDEYSDPDALEAAFEELRPFHRLAVNTAKEIMRH